MATAANQVAPSVKCQALLVAGYYRSGTSALCGTLSLAGVDIVNSCDVNEYNTRGFFENPSLIQRDLEIFDRLKRPWTDIRMMPQGWQQRPDFAGDVEFIAHQMRVHHDGKALWATKHPDLCRLLPVYAAAAERATGRPPFVIHIFRDPWAVAASQFTKNRLSAPHALLLWVSHVLEAEQNARPFRQAKVIYDAYLRDPSGSVRTLADTLGISLPAWQAETIAKIDQYATPNLKRSQALPRDRVPADLADLVDRTWEAVTQDADAGVIDALAVRLEQYAGLIDGLAASSARITETFDPTVRQQAVTQKPGLSALGPTGSPLRPAEHMDGAERSRLQAALEKCAQVPTLDVIVLVPRDAAVLARNTERSIEAQWRAPRSVTYVHNTPDAPQGTDWVKVDDQAGALTRKAVELANASDADYVTILDAGIYLEPDAIARVALCASSESLPALLYADEIIAGVATPWVRYKPEFDIERLRGLYYLGGSLWMRTSWLRDHVPLAGERVSVWDHDVALRTWEEHGAVVRIPEALHTWTPAVVGDKLGTGDLRTAVRAVLHEHFARCGLRDSVATRPGQIEALFEHRYQAVDGVGAWVVLLCSHAAAAWASRLTPNAFRELLNERCVRGVIVAAVAGAAHDKILRSVRAARAGGADGTRFRAVVGQSEADVLRQIVAAADDGPILFRHLEAQSPTTDWMRHTLGKLLDPTVHNGAVGVAGTLPGRGGPTWVGPLLLGGAAGVGSIGSNRSIADAGPGFWLGTPQHVDGILPVAAAFSGEALHQVDFADDLSGAAFWLDVGLQLQEHGFDVVWDPTLKVALPAGGRNPEVTAPAVQERLRVRRGCTSRRHHPALALHGDPLGRVQQVGMYAPYPRTVPHLLVSGVTDEADFFVQALREARTAGSVTAGWVAEPLAVAELLRMAPQSWIRIQAASSIPAPDAPPWRAFYSRAPDLHLDGVSSALAQAMDITVTSPGIKDRIAGMIPGGVPCEVVVPRLPGRVWKDFVADVPRARLRVLWVDEGQRPDWFGKLLAQSSIEWFVVGLQVNDLASSVSRMALPRNEDGWRDLYRNVRPHVVIRPIRDAVWLDCQALLRGAAAGAVLMIDSRLDCPEELNAVRLEGGSEVWHQALMKMAAQLEETAATGRQTRAALERIGWLEDKPLQLFTA